MYEMNQSSVLSSYHAVEVASVCCSTCVPLNPDTAVWSSDKLLVNKRYCSMCINVPESAMAKCEPGDCCTFVCSIIRQVCV